MESDDSLSEEGEDDAMEFDSEVESDDDISLEPVEPSARGAAGEPSNKDYAGIG